MKTEERGGTNHLEKLGPQLLPKIYNPPEKIQDVGLWASKMRLSKADQT